jgi:hypothetical protein
MNNSIVFLLVAVALITSGCNDSFEYKYQEKANWVKCEGADALLLNEALYSFFDDITLYYREKFGGRNGEIGEVEAYASYIYDGAKGTSDYKNIASEHTIRVIEKLKNEKQLWNVSSEGIKLNYESAYVSCLIENVENTDMKKTLKSLKKVNYLSPTIMADRFRINTKEAVEDQNYAMYVVLDTYYQRLLNIDFSKAN